jgi:chemotaxis protein methyltransferase CheR
MVNVTDKEYEILTDYILNNYGIKLGDRKKTLVVGRFQNILLKKGFSSLLRIF